MPGVVLGMSGGVDSSVSARLLRDRGYEVTGVYLIMNDGSERAAEAAAANAAALGIRFITEDVRELIDEKIKKAFASAYLSGLTPNPCVACNAGVKFPSLFRVADRLGARFVATGHYAGIRDEGGPRIVRGKDPKKDQSYFLYRLGQEELSRIVFPLADLTKAEVRKLASELGLPSSSASDSQDVCFLPDGEHGEFVSRYAEGFPQTGLFRDASGKQLGVHEGYWRYTPGQRRGLGVSASSRLYVQRIIPSSADVVLGTEDGLYYDRVTASDCVFPGDAPDGPFRADVCLRYTKKASPALVTPRCDGCVIDFDAPQRAPAPGQSAVFYDGDKVIGGGMITGCERIER